ncbi:hypothetical protein HYH03_010900 [Edaphochlamys debaryana]|uniref:Uncharacterized protein n=1 Tax=Edaphochlamys debaryana TaxID=47281 RepID=A0A835Y1D7_9CHLO|nr:hypothetical protein HYH03_010900 [Edaphochlamys debaryana]|eukprot:KAG2490745.1 hypothetical protein HYH03_010900 [Edaphochlamys debaryana]
MLSLMMCSLLQRSVAAPCPVSNCAMPAAPASAGPYGTYPSLPPPPPRTLSTVPLHPSVPEDAQRSGFVLSASGRLLLPGSIQVTLVLNGSGYVTQCTLNVTFYEVHPDSGELVRALTDTHVVDAAEWVLFDARAPRPCAAGLVGAAVDEAGGWLYYPVVATLTGPTQYNQYGREVARSSQSVLLVRQISLDGSGGSRTVFQQDTSNSNSSVFGNGRLSSSIALSGPVDASAGANASAAFLLLSPYETVSGLVLAVDLSGSGVVRARPVGLGVQATAWAVDQSTSSGTSTYDMYLLYQEGIQYDSNACRELADMFAFQQTPLSLGSYSCSSWWVARDRGAASAAAVATWPISTWTTWTSSAAPPTTKAAAPPGVDVEIVPFTLTTTTWPGPAQLAAGSSLVYLSDVYRCQILELDPTTAAAKVAAGYDGGGAGASGGGGCTRPVCSVFPSDGPATGNRAIASPGRMAADGSGALVFVDETTGRLRRLGPA